MTSCGEGVKRSRPAELGSESPFNALDQSIDQEAYPFKAPTYPDTPDRSNSIIQLPGSAYVPLCAT
jgi:hypothetical protein